MKDALEQAKIVAGVGRGHDDAVVDRRRSAASSAEQMVKLLEALEDHDDVQNVSSNMDIAAEELERLSA